jgi:hypothetical protein
LHFHPIYRLRAFLLALFWGVSLLLGVMNAVWLVAADWKYTRAWNNAWEDSTPQDLAAVSALYPWDQRFRMAPARLVGHLMSLNVDATPQHLAIVKAVRRSMPTSLALMVIEYRVCERLHDEVCKDDVAQRFLTLLQHQRRTQ